MPLIVSPAEAKALIAANARQRGQEAAPEGPRRAERPEKPARPRRAWDSASIGPVPVRADTAAVRAELQAAVRGHQAAFERGDRPTRAIYGWLIRQLVRDLGPSG